MARVAAHDSLPQVLSNLGLSDIERVLPHLMRLPLVFAGKGLLLLGSAHSVDIAAYIYHFIVQRIEWQQVIVGFVQQHVNQVSDVGYIDHAIDIDVAVESVLIVLQKSVDKVSHVGNVDIAVAVYVTVPLDGALPDITGLGWYGRCHEYRQQ